MIEQSAPFVVDHTFDGKAITKSADGDLYIEGWAADWGADDQDEAFEPDAFKSAIDDFMSRDRPLLYHHGGLALGQVEQLELRPQGLWMKARVDKPEPGTEAMDVFNKIQRGTIRGLSTAGRFWRRLNSEKSSDLDASVKIWKARLREISVTPIPVSPTTLFNVSEKAFSDPANVDTDIDEETLRLLDEAVLTTKAIVDELEKLAPPMADD
jgi:HK97 family phage prohead protease